jgi:ferritin-like metal-binding protein YciE
MAESTQERLVRYLDDAWAVEKTLVGTLGDMAREVRDPTIRSLFEDHQRETQQHMESLEARIQALGEQPSHAKGFFNQAMAKMGDAFRSAHDEYDKEVENLMKAYAAEGFELAMYAALESYAGAVGDQETVRLARRISAEEKAAADKIWPQIVSSAGRPAREAAPR